MANRVLNEINDSSIHLNSFKGSQLSDLTNQMNLSNNLNETSNQRTDFYNNKSYSNLVDQSELAIRRKEMNKYRRDLMFLPLNQHSSSPKKQKYNQWMNDVLTPILRDDCTLQTPDLNKCAINTPEEELILRGFKLPSTPNNLPHSSLLLSPLLLSPNLHSPTFANLFESFSETKSIGSLFDSPLNGNFSPNFEKQNDKSNNPTNSTLAIEATDDKVTKCDVKLEKTQDEKETEQKSNEVTVNSSDVKNQMETDEIKEHNERLTGEIQVANQIDQTSSLPVNEINVTDTKPTDAQSLLNNSISQLIKNTIESNVQLVQPSTNHFNNSFPINQSIISPSIYPRDSIFCSQRSNPHLITNLANNPDQNHPITTNYAFNRTGHMINNHINHFYNNQPFVSYSRPATCQPMIESCPKSVERTRKSTSSVNSNDSQSTNEKRDDADASVKLEDKKAKNRAAATRCRQRKQERVNYLEDQVRKLKDENIKLAQSQNQLVHMNNYLKHQLFLHTKNGCTLMDYNNNCKLDNIG